MIITICFVHASIAVYETNKHIYIIQIFSEFSFSKSKQKCVSRYIVYLKQAMHQKKIHEFEYKYEPLSFKLF
jgi:hypothetical protein